jgi:hypothetical protein
LIISFSFYFFRIYKIPANNLTATSTATSSVVWTVYKNTDLGFQIDYQNNLTPRSTHPTQGNAIYGPIVDNISFNYIAPNGDIDMWEIGVTVTIPTQTMSNILKASSNEIIFEKKFIIDGFDAYEYGIPEEKGGPVYTHIVLVMNGKKLYEIDVQEGQHNDQLINSFHFLK